VKRALSILPLPFVLAAALMAQEAGAPNNPENYVKRITAQLGLSSEQQAQAATIFSDAAAAEAPLRAQLTLAQSKAKAAFYRILTPEQQAELSQLESPRPGVFRAGPRR
jgi:hypothetical protein